MEKDKTIEAFSALAQPTRMDAFKLIVMHEPGGIAAGEVSRILDVPRNTMSTHLSRAGLISSERQSRSIIYRANFENLREAINFLLKDCCAGHPDICSMLPAQGELQCMIASITSSFSALETLHDRSWQNRS